MCLSATVMAGPSRATHQQHASSRPAAAGACTFGARRFCRHGLPIVTLGSSSDALTWAEGSGQHINQSCDLNQAIIEDLLHRRRLREAKSVVLVGASAGGLGVLMQADDWAMRITHAAPHAKPRLVRSHNLGTRVGNPAGTDTSLFDIQAVMVDAGLFPAYQASSSLCLTTRHVVLMTP